MKQPGEKSLKLLYNTYSHTIICNEILLFFLLFNCIIPSSLLLIHSHQNANMLLFLPLKTKQREFLHGLVAKTHYAPSAGSPGLVPGQGTRYQMWQLKIPRATTKTWHSQRNKKANKYFFKKPKQIKKTLSISPSSSYQLPLQSSALFFQRLAH